jgi:stage V sporulation protein G
VLGSRLIVGRSTSSTGLFAAVENPRVIWASCGMKLAAALDQPETRTVRITVLTVTPVQAGKLFALASVEIDIDDIQIHVHGIRALRIAPVGTRIELPKSRDAAGMMRPAVSLPDEVRHPIGDAVLEALIERGLAERRFAVPVPA